jgi:predicted nucleic acid-binding protein
MERPRVYIETTIPSAYFDERRDPAMLARREATRRWWATAGERYELVTSVVTREELKKGPLGRRASWLELIRELPVLQRTGRVAELASVYVQHKVMPAHPLSDALHLAIASYHECDYLLTWNFKHLANPNKFAHIRRVNASREAYVPRIVPPLDLLEVNDG